MCRVAPIAALIAATTLAGCNKSPTVEAHNESPQAVASKVAAADLHLSPGRWESQVKIEKMDMGAMPPQAKAMMERALGTVRTVATCLTPEQAAKPNAGFFNGNGNSRCTYKSFTMGGGKIAGDMTCDNPGGTQHMTLDGTYSADDYAVHIASQGAMAQGMTMDMAMAVTSHRTGPCTGKE